MESTEELPLVDATTEAEGLSPDAAPAITTKTATAKSSKVDATIAAAVDEARMAAQEAAADFGVGDHLGCVREGDNLATHYFACTHPAYPGWRWAVSMARVPRARAATVDEVVLLPAEEALLAPAWVPWSERLRAGDVHPGMLLPTPDNDLRLEPGYVPPETTEDPLEWAETRAVVAELGLGRERVLSAFGRDEAARRWLSGDSGPDNAMTRLAPATCWTCGYFVRLAGGLGRTFGACANEYSPSDGRIVAVSHGCGGHSDVVADEGGIDLAEPVFDTITVDHPIFD